MAATREPVEQGLHASSNDEAEPRKPSRTILKQEIIAGLAELRRPTSGLFLSSLSAGLDIGFSVLMIGVVYTHFLEELGPAITRIGVATAYSVGFILVILGRSELFTEHTTLAVLPVLDGRSSLRDLARAWTVVFCGNLLGALVFAGAVQWLAPAMGAVDPWAFNRVATEIVDHSWWVIILSGVLAGWLMGELGWLVAASRDTISQVACVWIITSVIGLAQLHHVVVGSAEVAVGFMGGATGPLDLLRFVVLAGTGNALGGVIFVAIIKYGHAKRSEEGAGDELNLEKKIIPPSKAPPIYR
jgi:formate/nitrite transporter FocA (FNT family)